MIGELSVVELSAADEVDELRSSVVVGTDSEVEEVPVTGELSVVELSAADEVEDTSSEVLEAGADELDDSEDLISTEEVTVIDP